MFRLFAASIMALFFVLPAFASFHASAPEKLGINLPPVAHGQLHAFENQMGAIVAKADVIDPQQQHLLEFIQKNDVTLWPGALRFENHPQHQQAHAKLAAVQALYALQPEDLNFTLKLISTGACMYSFGSISTSGTFQTDWHKLDDVIQEIAQEHPTPFTVLLLVLLLAGGYVLYQVRTTRCQSSLQTV